MTAPPFRLLSPGRAIRPHLPSSLPPSSSEPLAVGTKAVEVKPIAPSSYSQALLSGRATGATQAPTIAAGTGSSQASATMYTPRPTPSLKALPPGVPVPPPTTKVPCRHYKKWHRKGGPAVCLVRSHPTCRAANGSSSMILACSNCQLSLCNRCQRKLTDHSGSKSGSKRLGDHGYEGEWTRPHGPPAHSKAHQSYPGTMFPDGKYGFTPADYQYLESL
ncbi:hypothetical protein ACET3X_005063 [Alternaria dauci]|uniref:B box-type domain-containing protein n=1 Tax=Alternaria dauci TaxID=48095 RepID=A0ABR3UJ71_9PLEO